ncbi:hypothetical protein BB029_31170 [Pseudomonas sp. S3E12]|nr:hypothetical protein BB029_31170 [Pseudomonas sp. S3E12]
MKLNDVIKVIIRVSILMAFTWFSSSRKDGGGIPRWRNGSSSLSSFKVPRRSSRAASICGVIGERARSDGQDGHFQQHATCLGVDQQQIVTGAEMVEQGA